MTESELVALSKAYVALSNAHRLEFISPMFSLGAVYRSSAVGEFSGKAEIENMMRSFFAKFPNVHWRAKDYRVAENNTVQFDFTMTATNVETGEVIQRTGIEKIQYNIDDLICYLEVDAK